MTVRIPGHLVAVCVVLAVLVTSLAAARSGGIYEQAREGCGGTGCHVGGADTAVSPEVDLPANWTPNRTYPIGVEITGARDPLPDPSNRGGFSLEVSAGVLIVPNGSEAVQVNASNPKLATHTDAGNDQRNWSLEWGAPAEGTDEVTVWVAVNAVNGNGAQDPADQWNTAQATIPYAGDASNRSDGDGDPIPNDQESIPAWTAGLVVMGLLVAVWTRTRRQ